MNFYFLFDRIIDFRVMDGKEAKTNRLAGTYSVKLCSFCKKFYVFCQLQPRNTKDNIHIFLFLALISNGMLLTGKIQALKIQKIL